MIFKLWTKLQGIMLHHCISTKFAIHSLVVLSYKKKLKKGHNVKTLKYGMYIYVCVWYVHCAYAPNLAPIYHMLEMDKVQNLAFGIKNPMIGILKSQTSCKKKIFPKIMEFFFKQGVLLKNRLFAIPTMLWSEHMNMSVSPWAWAYEQEWIFLEYFDDMIEYY